MMRIPAFFLFLFLFTTSASVPEDAKKGNEAYESGDYALAETHYRAAIEAEPENARLYFNLANAMAKQNKVEEAVQMFMEFASLTDSPDDKAKAEYNIGTLLSENEQWKPAVQHLKNALTYNASDNDAKHNFERALKESQREEEEEQQQNQDQNQPQEPPSDYAKAMKKRAEQLVTERKYTEAYNLMQEALKVDQTVQNYNDFINRIGAVDEIDS